MSIRKIAVLSMLVVMLIATNIPASAQIVGAAGISSTAVSSFSATSAGFGAFGGFGWPFNWGFAPWGIGCWPFNWALGGGWGPFSLFGWNHFSPCFGGCNGFPFSPGFLGCGCCQSLPFILGSPLGCSPVLGWDASPWAFGLQSCVRSLPLYFGAHGFGFPFTLGNYRIGLIPSCCCGPAAVPVPVPACGGIPPVAGGLAKGIPNAAVAK